jgi:hypothetical protein
VQKNLREDGEIRLRAAMEKRAPTWRNSASYFSESVSFNRSSSVCRASAKFQRTAPSCERPIVPQSSARSTFSFSFSDSARPFLP